MGFEGFPLIVGWELTLACNLRCRHCGSSAALPRAQELTLEESLSICDQLPELLTQEVDFTGGEPLLKPGWSKIAARLAELDIHTKVLSNGLLLEPDMVARIKDVGIAGVGVSIDGLEATHDRIRGRDGLFRRVVAGIEEVQKADIPVSVITTVNALNIDELDELLLFLQSVGVNTWQVQPIFPLGRGLASDLQLSGEAYRQLGLFVQAQGEAADNGQLALMPGDSYGYFTELDTRQPPWRGCSAGVTACGITSEGKIKGCLSMPDELVEGDLRQNDLWEIWFHPDSFAYNRRWTPNDLGAFCQDCDRAIDCRGGCSAMSYGATGRFHNDPYCFYAIERGSPYFAG
ncbi:MAG: radical SAM protein [Anaerolineae bacterium]|jgi:radical SAM protein with 4Fe4S-binding SPASM domain